jgi:uncharacterized protein
VTLQRIYRWRRADGRTLEVLRLMSGPRRLTVRSNLVDADEDAFSVDYQWSLDTTWRTRSLRIRVVHDVVRRMRIERTGDAQWRIDGVVRPDLDGCEEIDLSITPFCNTLALRRFGPPGGAGELTTLYVAFPELSATPSRQRYDKLGSGVFRYVDLGLFNGFEARLTVDDDGLVRTYESLFERIENESG